MSEKKRSTIGGVEKLYSKLFVSLFAVGLVTQIAGFSGHLVPQLWLLLLIPLYVLFQIGFCVVQKSFSFRLSENFLLVCVVLIWLTHFTGVLVPETGFDAVWYHLPIVDAFAKQGGYIYLPHYYQSLNPFFSDGVFLLGYLGLGEFGAKLVAYLFALSLMLVSYKTARLFFNRFWSLLFLLSISSFQVIAWQSSSFYVDVAKAFWELVAIFYLLKSNPLQRRQTFISGMFFGAALATKLFSLLLLPIFGVILWLKIDRSKYVSSILLFSIASLIISLPFYFQSYMKTGEVFYSFGVHTDKLAEIGGSSSVSTYLLQRTLLLPSSLTQLTFFSRDYTTLLFLTSFPLAYIYIRQILIQKKLLILVIFSVGQWLIWWYLPPLSTRYALSGFITLLVVFFWCIQQYLKEKPKAKNYIFFVLWGALLINLLPRAIVLKRNSEYIFGKESKEEYVRQFYDGWIDDKLKAWHHLGKSDAIINE